MNTAALIIGLGLMSIGFASSVLLISVKAKVDRQSKPVYYSLLTLTTMLLIVGASMVGWQFFR